MFCSSKALRTSMYWVGSTEDELSNPLKLHFERSGKVIFPTVYSVSFTSSTFALAAYPTCTSREARTLILPVPVTLTSSTFLKEILLPSAVILAAVNVPRLTISPVAEAAAELRGSIASVLLLSKLFRSSTSNLRVDKYRFPTFTCAVEPNTIPLGLIR